VSAESVAGESLGGPDGTPPASTLGTAGFRVLGALAVVGVLLTLTLLVLQRLFRQGGGTGALSRLRRSPGGWLSRWMPAPPPAADRLEILERSYVGARESVCIVRAGAERFLIGVTASRICLLGRLEPVREVADPAEEPAAADFARAVSGTVAPRPGPAEGAFQALLARSRERLTRLGIDSVHAGARRE
jgi:flagellar biogenesis protein FliO